MSLGAERIVRMVDFEQAVKDCTGGQQKVKKRDYLPKGEIPIIDQGQSLIAGFTNDSESVYSGDLPIILFGDHTLIFKYVDFPFALGADGVKALSIHKGFEPKYLYYSWQSCRISSRGYSRHFKFLKEIRLPLIPLSEQKRIVEILDQADALRKNRADADTKAARIVPALFYKMFGDPATNPNKWQLKPLSDHGAEVRYGLGQPPRNLEKGVPLIRATNISCGRISRDSMLYVDPNDVPAGRNAFLRADEVIVVRSGAYTGDVAQVTEEWKGAVAGYDLVITPGDSLTGEFLETFLLTPHIQNGYFHNLKSRAGQPHLNASQLSATPVPVIPRDKQDQFSGHVKSIRFLRNRWEDSNRRMNILFEVLLHRAFSGDLTGKWRGAHMKELLVEMEAQTKYLDQ